MALEKLGKYELQGVLGKGAAGTVYDARDPVIGRRVAIKTVKLPNADDDDTRDELDRFRREARAAGGLSHPNIVPIFDYGETTEIAYIVMEFIGGGTLTGLLKKQTRLPAPEALRIMDELLAGLQFSHEKGIVHRDIKPDIVMLTDDNTVKIADFGIARIEGSGATLVGTMLGTPSYMSPEQWRGDAHIDARSDIYAAGVLLYHLLTGRRPFEGNQSAIMHKVLSEEAVAPSSIYAGAPPELDAVILRAIAKRREDRYRSADDFADALKEAASGRAPLEEGTIIQSSRRPAVTPAPSPTRAPPPARPSTVAAAEPAKSRLPLLIGAGAGGVVVIGAVLAWLLWPSKPPVTDVAIATPPTQPEPRPAPPAVTPPAVVPPVVVAPPVAPPPAVVPPVVAPPPVVRPPAAPQVAPPPAVLPPPSVITPPAPPPAVTVAPPAPGPREILAGTPCAMVYGEASPNRLALRGIVPDNSLDALRYSYDRTSAASRNWDVRVFPPLDIYCQVIQVLRPALRSLGETRGVVARLIPSPTTHQLRLVDNDPIDFEIDGPDFASNLHVDYIGSDGKVSHYMPRAANPSFPARLLKAGQHVRLFDTVGKGGAFTLGPPFGTDLVVIIAASEPLRISYSAEDDEPVATYLARLQPKLEDARRRNVRLSIDIVLVESIEKAP